MITCLSIDVELLRYFYFLALGFQILQTASAKLPLAVLYLKEPVLYRDMSDRIDRPFNPLLFRFLAKTARSLSPYFALYLPASF
jgi:hypothetical protein